jgi:hypothetical protein
MRLSGFRLEQQQEDEERQGIKEIEHTEKSPCPFCKEGEKNLVRYLV